MPLDSHLTCGDITSSYNYILKDQLVAGKDYQIISKEQWHILSQHYTKADLYPVYPIRRFYERMGMGIRTFPDVTYHRFDVCIVMGTNSRPVFDVMYFSKKRTWEDLKKRAVKIIRENPKFA
jgi:hypothetical protein